MPNTAPLPLFAPLRTLRRQIAAQVPRKAARDLWNRFRYGAGAPLSDEGLDVPLAAITHSYRPDPSAGAPDYRRWASGMVVDGGWDQSVVPYSEGLKERCLIEHFDRGVAWEETELFQHMVRQIESGHTPDGLRTLEDVTARYAQIDKMFAEAARLGRLRRRGELPEAFRREHGGIFVHVDRNGRPLRFRGGAHRFAVARILGLNTIPVQVGVVHLEAVRSGAYAALRAKSEQGSVRVPH